MKTAESQRPAGPDWFTPKEAAEVMRLNLRQVRREIAARRLSAKWINRRVVFVHGEWIESWKRQPNIKPPDRRRVSRNRNESARGGAGSDGAQSVKPEVSGGGGLNLASSHPATLQ